MVLGSEQLSLKELDHQLENCPEGQGAVADPGERRGSRLGGPWRAEVGSQGVGTSSPRRWSLPTRRMLLTAERQGPG